LFSKEVLQLTWWPLFRDMFFYIFALLLLMMFFVDDAIEVHEALSMFIIYVIYAIIMKYNERLEAAVKIHFLGQAKISASECSTEAVTMPSFSKRISNESVSSIRADRRKSIPVLQSGALFRSSIATLAREGTISEEDNKTTIQKQRSLPPVEEVHVRPTVTANSSNDSMKRTGAAAMPGSVRSVSGYLREEAAFGPVKRNKIPGAIGGDRQSSETTRIVEKNRLKPAQKVGDGDKRINESSLAPIEDNRK
uniref:Sodium/calcium exchanger membrane region domain-containing protein n=1 Tax=Parascaris univalens TaxID=6257 RepID=A0A915B6J8_PARUN